MGHRQLHCQARRSTCAVAKSLSLETRTCSDQTHHSISHGLFQQNIKKKKKQREREKERKAVKETWREGKRVRFDEQKECLQLSLSCWEFEPT